MKLVNSKVPKSLEKLSNNTAVMGTQSALWGQLPAFSLISAIGVFLVALAYEGGRVAAQQWPEPLFWLGLMMIFLPIAVRQLSSKPARRERIALLIILTINLYLVQYLLYPLHFSGYDEFAHWLTAQNIVTSGHLFLANPLLPISPFYPGLEIATSALSSLTGLSIFVSGTIIRVVILLVFVLSLYLFYEHISKSARIAGIATLLYMANPQFLFFDMDFSYESFALPLAVFVLFAITYRSQTHADRRKGLTLIIWLGLGVIVVSHHVTSYALVAFLFFWTAVFLLFWARPSFLQTYTQRNQIGPRPGAVAVLGFALCLIWLQFTGDIAIAYLGPHLGHTAQQLLQIFTNGRAPRQLFKNNSGLVVPLWERMLSYASVALILLGLPFGFLRIWQRHRNNLIAIVLAIATLAYPVSQALRLTPAGGETGNRATEFVFLAMAFVLAIAITEYWLSHTQNWRRSALIVGATGLLCFGQMVLGSGLPWTLLPGPYLVSADARSIEPEGITAAQWAYSYLGPGQRIGSDRINTLLLATYGSEQVITGANSNAPVSSIFTSLKFGPGALVVLRQDNIEFLLVDHRLSTSLPYVGTYFNLPANGGQQNTRPMDPAALAKFDSVQNVSRIFDSGDIVIYNVESITNGSPASSTRKPLTPRPARPRLSQPTSQEPLPP
jgi:hypothetical protein